MKTYADWLKEHYPTPANDPEALAKPITHSLRKWRGMRADVLKKYNLYHNNSSIYVEGESRMDISTATCALCVKHYRVDLEDYDEQCKTCPLSEVRGVACDKLPSNRDKPFELSPYHAFTCKNDPEPMIKLLEAALQEYPE